MKRRVAVRQAEKTDVNALTHLSEKLATKQGLPSSGGLRSFAIEGVSGENTITIVQTHDSEVVGMLIVSKHKQQSLQDCAIIRGVILEPAYCEDGSEARFLAEALKICANMGIRHVRKCAIAADGQTLGLFFRCGFRRETTAVRNQLDGASPMKLVVLQKDI